MLSGDEVFYKICFDSQLEGIIIIDKSGKIVMANVAVERIFGYKNDVLKGTSIEYLFPEKHRENYKNFFLSYSHLPKRYRKEHGLEVFGLHKNGKLLELELGLNYFNHDGKLYIVALMSEFGIRRKKEQRIKEKNKSLQIEVAKQTSQLMYLIGELEHSNRQLKEKIAEKVVAEKKVKKSLEKEKELNQLQAKFISLASHEFKTPLSGILTSAGLIEKYNNNDFNEKIDHHALTIKTLVSQLNDILDDFLFLKNAESENYALRLSSFKFCDLIKKLVQDAEPLLKDGQRIEIKPCKSPVVVCQDKKVIDIILRNVLYNAIKFSPEDSIITMEIYRNNFLHITIEDHGIGIPSEALRHLFKRFYRAKNALPIQGTGLGLHIAKSYLERLDGSINIESKEGKGTKVYIKLPVSAEEPNKKKRQVPRQKQSILAYEKKDINH